VGDNTEVPESGADAGGGAGVDAIAVALALDAANDDPHLAEEVHALTAVVGLAFAEAKKYAPDRRRLHLKWGEALTYAGTKNDAEKQFARAAGLDLISAEKSELARVTHG